jgi:hypothetical protein
MNPATTEPNLTFQGPVEKGFPFLLFVCVAGSLLAHAATFFLFQVVYPQRVTIPQPAPHVSLLTPSSPENIALLRWIEAEDPALIASDNSVPPPALAQARYRPSFSAPRTAPQGAPAEKSQEVRFPPAIDHLATSESAPLASATILPVVSPTTVQFTGALASRPLTQKPPLDGPRHATAPVNPTILLIGVNDRGEIRYQSLQQSSGDNQLDALAASHLRRLSFAPADQSMTWAHVTFSWGADVYAEVTPPPARTSEAP